MLIAIIRHGETIENSQQIIQGHLPGQLSDIGKEQATLIGANLKKLAAFDLIISSDLHRAKQTASIVSRQLEIGTTVYDESLRERFFGEMQGMPIIKLKRKMVEENANLKTINIPGGEKYADFEKRVIRFYNKITYLYAHQNLIMVTHAGVIKALLEYVTGEEPQTIANCGGFLINCTNEKEVEVQPI